MNLQVSSNTNNVSENNVESNSNVNNNATEDGSQNSCDDAIFTMEDLEKKEEEKKCAHTRIANLDKDPVVPPPVQSVELAESLPASHVTMIDQREQNGINETSVGERCQAGCITKESSVHVQYTSLPSCSKRKLEELLLQWSEWHAKNCTSVEDHVECVESGEETYFPALHVGLDKSSTVSFSMDVHVRKKQRKGPFLTDNDCSALYDRGYAVGLASDEGVTEERAVDLREAPRCFNCGSYNHSLNECSRPRDNNAVNSARKRYLNKKNQNAGPRVPTRYYQESPGGKFDGLKPGALSSETRKLLGIGELDPPPWLNRMRELGYPPGYLQAEDQPSGIAIYGDEDTNNGTGKNDHSLDPLKSQKKMTVDFPGINVPMPENADPWLWTAPTPRCPPPPDLSWNQLNRQNHPQDSVRPNHHNSSSRFSLGSSPPLPHYPHHYYPSEPYSSRGIPIPAPAGPSYGRPYNPGMPLLHFNYGSF
uniref:PSP proline-rich domain-containing protein n=2 Tax=Opuntia streptacantha TaxID=393608 RepID=A0A7C9A1V0_OPUST